MEWHLDKEVLDFGFADDGTIVMDWNDGRRSSFDPRPFMKGSLKKLLDQDYLKTAYLVGYGRAIAWPDNIDFGVGLLYEESDTVDSTGPLPPRGPRMTWEPNKLVVRVGHLEDGKLAVDWNDGTQRRFDVWDHASDDAIEKFVDPVYLAQARVAPERDAIVWPDGERFDAKTLYERSAIVEG